MKRCILITVSYNIVVALAKTGKDSNKRTIITKTDHANSGMWSKSILNPCKLPKVLIKLTAPKNRSNTCKI